MAEAAIPPAATAPARKGKRVRTPRAPDSGWRSFVTPEGVDLGLQVGEAGSRALALILDLLIVIGLLIVLSIASCSAMVATGEKGGEVVGIIWLLGFFVLRNFYFTGFELSARAATPGKRAMGLRVIARDGGRLTGGAVFVRNVTREIEVFLPAMLLLASAGENHGVDGWLIFLGVVWTGIFMLFPLFNRDRLRVGDLIAGTMVVRSPRRVLAADLADTSAARFSELSFTEAQVDAYGIKELHVLEDVLRRADRRTQADVARRIRGKIGWPEHSAESDRAFLDAYYAALRRRLENRLLFGRRRADKFDVG